MSTLEDLLSKSSWMHQLSAAEKRTVTNALIVRSADAGGYVCRRGEAAEHWFGIIEGTVKLSSESQGGRAVTFTCVTAGGWFGEGSLLKDEARRYDAIALRDTRAACLPRATFHWLLHTSMTFNRFLVNHLNERLGQIIAMLEFDRTLDRDTRVRRCLSGLYNPQLYPGTDPHLDISQEEIAHLCGLSRQQVNQALHSLEAQGWLRVNSRGITVTDLPGLRVPSVGFHHESNTGTATPSVSAFRSARAAPTRAARRSGRR
jgi:CRP/FNR family cyclic AMP-dependent transcriptional regulator